LAAKGPAEDPNRVQDESRSDLDQGGRTGLARKLLRPVRL
jgi:hypothetical protein